MKTISQKQIEANKQNAIKGGVKTDKGKNIVRFNARTHGILANLVAAYEGDFYKQYVDQLFDEFQPVSIIEHILVERIALHYLKLFRLAKAESEFMKACVSTHDYLMLERISDVDSTDIRQLADIYGRYETAIENRLYRAIKELKDFKSHCF